MITDMLPIMKKTLLLVFLLVLGVLYSGAQTLTIKGQVVDDSTNAGIAGVSIVVSETKRGLSTNQDGTFTVTATGRNALTLVFSYVGYRSQTITPKGTEPLIVRLHKEQSNLDEVVVVGYSAVKRRDLT